MAQKKYAVSDFDRVEWNGFGELYLSMGETESLNVEAEDPILSQIQVEVRQKTLYISIQGHWWNPFTIWGESRRHHTHIKYTLTVKSLRELNLRGAGKAILEGVQSDELSLRLAGAGDLSVENLTARTLKVDLPGAGRIQISGQAEEQDVRLSGAGAYETPRLKTRNASVRLNGMASATVWAEENLDASVQGMGKITYYGSPHVIRNIKGMGSISAA